MKRFQGLSRGGRLLLALAVGGAVFGIATAVQASIPDSKGVIHSCYQKNVGNLRVIDSSTDNCRKSEVPLNWNQTGPTGPTGPAGPSDAWRASGEGSTLSLGGVGVNLASISLPAGSYFLAGATQLKADTSGSFARFICDLKSPSTVFQDIQTDMSPGETFTNISTSAVVTLTSPDTISLQCAASATSPSAENWQLSAVKVGTVH